MPRTPKNRRSELAKLIRTKAAMLLAQLEKLESGQPLEYPALTLLGLGADGNDLARMCHCYIENKAY